jgi:hypothetical protein
MNRDENPELADRLDSLIRRVATARARRHQFDVEDLFNQAWLYANEPARDRTVQGHLEDMKQSKGARLTRGEQRLYKDIDKHLSEYVAEVNGQLPRNAERSTYGEGQQAVQINYGSRSIYWDGDPSDAAIYGVDPWSGMATTSLPSPPSASTVAATITTATASRRLTRMMKTSSL